MDAAVIERCKARRERFAAQRAKQAAFNAAWDHPDAVAARVVELARLDAQWETIAVKLRNR